MEYKVENKVTNAENFKNIPLQYDSMFYCPNKKNPKQNKQGLV